MTTLLTPAVGLEDLQRASFYVLFESVNIVIPQVSAYWNAKDARFDVVTGRKTSPTSIEPIANDNFHEGHRPSLILSDPTGYPNLAVFAMRADPSSENNQLDHFDSFSDSILIEIMVKANDEIVVNRRIQRTTEAVAIAIRNNQTMGGACTGLETAPSVIISDVMAMKSNASKGGYGQRYIWQGSALQYRIRKDAVLPGLDGDIFAGTGQTDYSRFIDQG